MYYYLYALKILSKNIFALHLHQIHENSVNVDYQMLVLFAHHSWQMKGQLLVINIGFYLEKCDKLCNLQHHFFLGVTLISWIPLYHIGRMASLV